MNFILVIKYIKWGKFYFLGKIIFYKIFNNFELSELYGNFNKTLQIRLNHNSKNILLNFLAVFF